MYDFLSTLFLRIKMIIQNYFKKLLRGGLWAIN